MDDETLRLWLPSVKPSRITVAEKHEILLALHGANLQRDHPTARLSLKLRTLLPRRDLPAKTARSLSDAPSAPIRIGVLGVAAHAGDEISTSYSSSAKDGSIDADSLRDSGLFDPPNIRPDLAASARSLITWPIDVPPTTEREAYSDQSLAGVVVEHEVFLNLRRDNYPLHANARLVMVDDLLAQIFENEDIVSELLSAKNEYLQQAIGDHLARVVPETSRFAILFTLHPEDPAQRELKLRGMSVKVTGDRKGGTLSLWKLDTRDSQRHPPALGRYDDLSDQIRFLSLGSKDGAFDGAPLQLLLDLGDLTVIGEVGELIATLELEREALFSGLRPFFADSTGHLCWGLGIGDEGTGTVKTEVILQFRIDINALFANRVSTRHLRLRFPGRSFGPDQRRQVLTVLRNLAFETPHELDESWTMVPARSIGSRRQYVLLRADLTEQNVIRAVRAGGEQASVTDQAQLKLQDIVLNIAVVGPEANRLAETSAELHRGISSVFGEF